MVTISVNVDGEKITLINQPVLASGTVAAAQIEFRFDAEWDGYGKIALFWDEDDEIYMAQVIDSVAQIPHEVLVSNGKMKFGVYGTNDGKRLVTAKVTYPIADGAYSGVAEETEEPTPSLLAQIESALGDIEEDVEQMRAMTRGARSLVAMESYSDQKPYAVGAVVMQDGHLMECVVPITEPESWTPAHWVERDVDYFLMTLAAEPRYGVSGVGGSSPALTRLYDAAEFSAPIISTDVIAGSSPFDNVAPFNRKKCVGSWSVPDGGTKAVFTVNAYYGDPDYTEDGTNGDYVAVEVDPFYYYDQGGILAVSAHQYPGYSIHPVCVDLDGNIREHTYLPCYALTYVDGHAVSLPGGLNRYGGYNSLRSAAKTYANADAANYAIIEPTAVWHYEWLLQTIEFATMNMQSVMSGASDMAYSNSDVIVAVPDANQIVVGAGGAKLVVGQTILFNTSYGVNVSMDLQNQITAISKCDSDGTLNASGEYYLITYDGTDRSGSIVVNSWVASSRPWAAGATEGYAPGVGKVLGHTGSPVNPLSGRYPMRYRWRENVYGNQNMTCLDLAAVSVEDGASYHVDWYYLADPRRFASKDFDVSDLIPSKGWVKLGITTPVDSYVSGYIKEMAADPVYPFVRVPTLTRGGGANTYYCDYASLVFASVARAVRRGGYLALAASNGPCYCHAYYAPSAAFWSFGAALYFLQ